MTKALNKYERSYIDRQREAVQLAVYGALIGAVERAGGQLNGLNVKFGEDEVLLILKAKFPGGHMIGYVGAEDLPQGMVKATREAGRDAIKWKPDKWHKDEV